MNDKPTRPSSETRAAERDDAKHPADVQVVKPLPKKQSAPTITISIPTSPSTSAR